MRPLHWLRRGIWSALRRSRMEQDLRDELAFHLESRTADLIRQGLSAADARRRARLELGRIEVHKEHVREALGLRLLDEMHQDARYALRALRASPRFSGTAILSLALGIGATTGIFSLLDAVILEPLPVARPHELVALRAVDQGGAADRFSTETLHALDAAMPAGQRLAAMTPVGRLPVGVGAAGLSERARVQLVSGEYFPTLGVTPHRGRLAIPTDAHAEQAVAVISHSFWQRRFGGSESVLGQEMKVSGHPLTIVGVAPPQFSGVWVGAPVDIWLPLSLQHAVHYRQNLSASGTFHLDRPWAPQPAIRWLTIVTRIGPGGREALQTTLDAGAEHHFASLDAGVQTADGSMAPSRRLELVDFQHGFSSVRQQYGQALWMLMGMAAVVLLVTCANVANLLLARATARQREVAVRLSLGAGRMRLVRQMLTESLLLSGLGGAAGLLVAYWTNRALVSMALGEAGLPTEPVLAALALDGRVLAFAVALSALTGILFGMVPALRATRFELNAVLKSAGPLTGRSSRSVMKPLVALQVGLSVVLVAGALLFGRSLYNLYRVDVGFDPHHHLSIVVDTRMAGYADLRLSALYERLTTRLEALPEVTAVSAAMLGLMANNTVSGGAYSFPGSDGTPVGSIPENRVGPRFFEAAGMRLVAGRDIGQQDTAGSPAVAVINTALARQHFGSETPVGQRFSRQIGSDATEIEVVGVMADARTQGLRHGPRQMVYYPLAQGTPPPNAELIVRTSGDPARLATAVRSAIAEVDPHLSIMEMATARERMRASLRQDRLVAFLTLAFGLLALALASLGIYGVLSYLVTRRTAELGIRKALGAPRGHIVSLVLQESLVWVAVGIMAGSLAAVAAARALEGFLAQRLFELPPGDWLSLGLATLMLLVVAGGAAYLPARRAWRIDPQLALRCE